MSDNELDEEVDIEILRQKNLQEREAFLASFMNDPLFADAVKGIKSAFEQKNKGVPKSAQKRKRGDSAFRFTGHIPLERRSSARLQNKRPEYTHSDLQDEKEIIHNSDSLDDLEEVVYQVKRIRRNSVQRRSVPAKIIPPEEVTESMIKNIKISGNKVYGADGTSCHQCRQKTIDTKTVCRSGFCIGIRGQFCGICVINRYGEDPAAALKDPNWQCYVCRGCCNCSFCRLKEGKRPTGILAPLAKTSGYKSVMDFLRSLKGYGDYIEPSKDPNNLLGFDKGDGILVGNKRLKLTCRYDVENFVPPAEDPDNLLGFAGSDAIMGGNKRITIKCEYDVEKFKSLVQF